MYALLDLEIFYFLIKLLNGAKLFTWTLFCPTTFKVSASYKVLFIYKQLHLFITFNLQFMITKSTYWLRAFTEYTES